MDAVIYVNVVVGVLSFATGFIVALILDTD